MIVAFYGACVLIHLALTLVLGSSVIFLLLDGPDVVAGWLTNLTRFWNGLWDGRRGYFAFCVLGNVLLLPLVVGLLDARMLRKRRRTYGVFLIPGAFFLLFVLVMFAVLRYKPFYLSHLGMWTFFLLIVLVGIWNAIYMPISILAHRINARIFRLMFGSPWDHEPGETS